ncbi:MAG: ATP-binding protein [Candidatus Sericytochromatia bacterium]
MSPRAPHVRITPRELGEFLIGGGLIGVTSLLLIGLAMRQGAGAWSVVTWVVALLLALMLGWAFWLTHLVQRQRTALMQGSALLNEAHTQHLETISQLQRFSNQWDTLLHNIQDAVLIADYDSGQFQEANPAASRLFGYSAAEFQVLKGRDLSPPEAIVRVQALSQRITREGFASEARMPLVTRSGVQFWGELNITVFEVHGRKLIFNIIRDITARVRDEGELIAAKDAAEAANQAKTAFLTNMSHEIRTPLNAVIGLHHLLLNTPLQPQQQDYLDQAHQAARHLLHLLNDVLDMSRIESGRIELESAPFALGELLESVLSPLASGAAQKQLTLSLDASADLPAHLLGDPLRLSQVLVNLLSNAIKFTEEGEVTLRVQALQQAQNRHLIGFCVQDTGIGIGPEALAQLFEPFSQADVSTTRRYGGSGLGLSISHHLVSLLGGHLEVESLPGRGSSFYFSLWLEATTPQAKALAPAPSALQPLFQGQRILLVEDQPINQWVARELLSNAQLEVDIASNGEMALQALARANYDLVLMDLHMPVMDGLSATQQLRSQPRWQHLPVIAMTADALSGGRESALKAGMNDYVTKPIEPETLFAVLQRWLPASPQTPLPEPETPPAAPLHQPAPPVVPPLDTERALRRAGGNRALYNSLLEDFAADLPAQIADLEHALADPKLALERAHALKGAAANLGARLLAAALARLEKSLKENAPPGADWQDCQAEAAALPGLVSAYLQTKPTP